MASDENPVASKPCEECAKYRTELADVKAMMMSMESSHAEVVKGLERKYNEETLSMQTLLDEAATEASSLTSRKFEQERTKLFENNNEMESEIKRLRRLVVESARTQQAVQQQLQEAQQSPSRNQPEHRDSNLSSNSIQMFEDEIEMLKIQLATANQEITKLTLEKEKIVKQAAESETAKAAAAKDNPMASLSPEETHAIAERLTQSEAQVKQLVSKLARTESELASIRTSASDAFERSKQELSRLREKFQSVVEVNRRLTFHYAKKSREMREEEINLPPTFDELLSSALMLREQVILERANRELLKEKTSQEIDLLRSELLAEQNEKQQMEAMLNSELESLRQELSRERAVARSKSLQGLQLSPSYLSEEPGPRKSLSAAPDVELEAVKHAKAALEGEVQSLRQQCVRLQVELDTSESVQQDLVRLSQSLQVSLEGLRDQSEVRWEFDDEVDQCRACKKALPVSHRKQHCHHCGKIFCDACLAQFVPSGAARRPAHVCSQCHFLLVQEAKPYFSAMADQNN